MKIRANLFVLLWFVVLSPFIAQNAVACSCSQNSSPCSAAGGSAAVFVGKVVGAKEQKDSYFDYKDGSSVSPTITYDVGEIYFDVKEAFAGVKKNERVTIHSGTGGGDCGFWFRRGETYLVYADGKPEQLYTSICDRTRLIGEADDDLTELRELTRTTEGARVRGAILEAAGLGRYDFDKKLQPLAGIELLLESIGTDKRAFKVKTDYQGLYEIADVPAGKYKVNVPLLKDTKLTERSSLEIETTGFGCVRQFTIFENKNQISGKIIDAIGKPVEDVAVEIISADDDLSVPTAQIPYLLFDVKSSGNFAFANVPAGRYFLSVRYVFRPIENGKADYPTAFYSAGKTAAQATPIIVGRADKIGNIIFQLPPKIEPTLVSGKVIWSDGKPVEASIKLFDVENGEYHSSEKANEAGEFTLSGFEKRKYKLLVLEQVEINGEWRDVETESPIFTLDKNTKPFKLTLVKPKEMISEDKKVNR